MTDITITVKCDRCGNTIDGIEHAFGTAGFYRVAPGSLWAKFGNPNEHIVCDDCMWKDPRYMSVYKRTI
jgi:hypothetical protein